MAKSVGNFSKDLSSGELDNELKAVAATAAGAGVALVSLNAALAAKDLMNFATYAKAVKSGAVAMGDYTAATKAGAIAQGALNLAQSISPMGWIAIAAGAAATAFVAYKAMTHEATTESELLKAKLEELNEELKTQADNQGQLASARAESFAGIETETSLVAGYVAELRDLTDANGKVVSGYEDRASYLSEQINNLIPGAVSASIDEANAYYKITESIDQMLFAKKKEMLLAAWETEYKDALKNRAAAQDLVRESAENQANAQAELDRLHIESLSAVGREEEVYAIKIAEAQKVLDASKQTTNEARASLETYQTTVNGFNTAYAAENMDSLNAATIRLNGNIVKATGENRAELEKAVVDAKTNLDMVVAEHAKSWGSMTDIEKREARNQVAELKTLLDTQATEAKRGGVELPENFGNGVTEGSPLFSAAMMEMFDKSKKTVEAAGASYEDVGYGYDIFFKQGIESGTEEVKAAGGEAGQAAIDGANAKSSEASTVGKFFRDGFINGISSGGGRGGLVWNTAFSMAATAVKAVKEAGDVNSPSRVMKRIGGFYSEGFGIGITDGISYARKAAHKLGNAVVTEISALNKELAKMQYDERKEQAEKDLAAHKKAIADKYAELGKAEKKDKQKILDEIAKLQADWNDKQVKAEKDAAKIALQEKIKTLEDFKKEYESALSDLEKKQQSMADKLSDYGKLFESVKSEDGNDLFQLGDLQGEIDKITKYGDALAKLKEQGISDSLMSEITSMNIDDAINYTDLLLKKTPKEYDKYMKLWEEKQKLAGETAKKFYSDEFAHLQTEFVDKVPTELGSLKKEMVGIGKNSAEGLANGFGSKKSYIVSTFKSVLETALQEAKEAMEIHSPSRKWAEVGSYMAQGLGVGFTDQMHSVVRQINNSIPVPSVDNSPIAKIVEGGVNGLASVVQGAGGTAPIVLQVHLNDREIASAIYDPLRDVARQRGY